jgi:hypothetical protein
MKLSQSNLLRLAAVAVLVVGVYAVMNSYSASKFLGEGLELNPHDLPTNGPLLSNDPSYPSLPNGHSEGGDMAPTMDQEGRHPTGQQTYSQTVLSPEEMLPMGGLGASWNATNPTGMGDLKGGNFLSSGYHAGINTVGTTLRNANLDLRSDPPNPRKAVSPFMNSTIEPDLYRRAMEIGEDGCGSGRGGRRNDD